jgi:hypothetical protein
VAKNKLLEIGAIARGEEPVKLTGGKEREGVVIGRQDGDIGTPLHESGQANEVCSLQENRKLAGSPEGLHNVSRRKNLRGGRRHRRGGRRGPSRDLSHSEAGGQEEGDKSERKLEHDNLQDAPEGPGRLRKLALVQRPSDWLPVWGPV